MTSLTALSCALAVAPACFLPPPRGYWVYGAGGFGRSLVRELRRLDERVIGFVDRKARETDRVDDLPCVHPDDFAPDAADGTYFTHGLMNWATPSASVIDWAARQPFSRLVFPSELYRLPGFSLSSYWLDHPDLTTAHASEIAALHDSLADDESRQLLVGLLRFRLTADPRLHPEVDIAGAYRPDFMPIRDRPITFIDAGAFTGDTYEALAAAGIHIAEWIAFEPDSANVATLRETARLRREASTGFTLIQAGLGARNGTVRFAADRGGSSCILKPGESSDGATTEIAIVRLDDVVRRAGDVYLKMDIEGAELDALEGMPELLARRPSLAISVYHRPRDLWEIPRRLRTLYDRPVLRLRQHGYQGFDTVLYATPE